jgi:hypothetical protein
MALDPISAPESSVAAALPETSAVPPAPALAPAPDGGAVIAAEAEVSFLVQVSTLDPSPDVDTSFRMMSTSSTTPILPMQNPPDNFRPLH